MSKKTKQNRFKPDPGETRRRFSGDSRFIDLCLKCIMSVAFISVLSLASIFVYDFSTQSNFFNIKQVKIDGLNRVAKDEILLLADLSGNDNIFGINRHSIEKRITAHPWIQSASVKRNFKGLLIISIVEQQPLAIVKIENLADILINTQGTPFKEYNPMKDHIENLPVISGLDLTTQDDEYLFYGPLFNSIMDLLKINDGSVMHIRGDKNTGIIVDVMDIYNRMPEATNGIVKMKLGFNGFTEKFNKAKILSEYIDKNFPEKTICAMDLFNIHKVFIKTKLDDTLHTNT